MSALLNRLAMWLFLVAYTAFFVDLWIHGVDSTFASTFLALGNWVV